MIEASLFTILEMERSEDTCLSFLFLVFLSRPLVTPSQRRRKGISIVHLRSSPLPFLVLSFIPFSSFIMWTGQRVNRSGMECTRTNEERRDRGKDMMGEDVRCGLVLSYTSPPIIITHFARQQTRKE